MALAYAEQFPQRVRELIPEDDRGGDVVEAYCRRLQHPDASIRESAALLRDAARIADIPGVLVQGRFDFQSPLANARALQRCWPGAQLVVVNDAGHAADHSGISAELKRALVRFATR